MTILVIFFLISSIPVFWVNYVFKKNDTILPNMPFNAYEFGEEIIKELKLKNVEPIVMRAENISLKFDFIVSRAVAQLDKFCPWISKNISDSNCNEINNGILYLKGGDLRKEINKVSKNFDSELINISDYYDDLFFESKSILYLKKK